MFFNKIIAIVLAAMLSASAFASPAILLNSKRSTPAAVEKPLPPLESKGTFKFPGDPPCFVPVIDDDTVHFINPITVARIIQGKDQVIFYMVSSGTRSFHTKDPAGLVANFFREIKLRCYS